MELKPLPSTTIRSSTGKAQTITQWTKDGKFIKEFTTTLSGIRGMVFQNDVLFIGFFDGATPTVGVSFVPITVTTDPEASPSPPRPRR